MIGQFIKHKRTVAGWSGTELAQKISTTRGAAATPSWLSRVENGETDPTFTQLRELAKAFGQTIREFVAEYESWQAT